MSRVETREAIALQLASCNAQLQALTEDLKAPRFSPLFTCESRDWRECVGTRDPYATLRPEYLMNAMRAHKTQDVVTLLCAGVVLERGCCEPGTPLMREAIKHLLLPPILRFAYYTDLRKALSLELRTLDTLAAEAELKRQLSERNALRSEADKEASFKHRLMSTFG